MFVKVILNTSVTNLDKQFTYLVPNQMEEGIAIGVRVAVPFGASNRKEIGVVLEITDIIDFDVTLAKSIFEVIDTKPLISEFSIKLAKWISKKYICNLSDALRLMFPPDVIKSQKKIRTSKKNKYVYINNECPLLQCYEDIKGITPKRKEVLEFLINVQVVLLSDLYEYFNTNSSFLNWFKVNNLIEIKEELIEENLFEKYMITDKDLENRVVLNTEQQMAYDKLVDLVDQGSFETALLHGVTGSGKTEVYMHVIQNVIQKGKTAIVLVPEISLTPQMANRFISRFGNVVSILHSKLSVGQRIDEYNKIRNGNIKIVIGARSAIFSPLNNIGVIVVDEEHDGSYKSEGTPKYNAIEVAQRICEYYNCLLLLGSATPSISTYYKAKNSQMHLLELKNRTSSSVLPNIEVVDMITESFAYPSKIITQKLYNEIENNLKKKEQTIIFLNKRGYCSSIVCKQCGFVYKCPNCDVSLTYHKDKHRLLCHYCGYAKKLEKLCRMCGSEELITNALGTQKVEEEIRSFFPNASILRMDHDTTTKKDSYIQILNKFKNDNIDILIGTQMVSKGHDFPNVTLVGILNADITLYLQDYKGNELTFDLLTQVAGRAGRNDKQGKVLLQTYQKDNSIFEYIKDNDYEKLYKDEIKYRQTLLFPPFCDIIQIVLVGENENNVIKASNDIFQYLKNKLVEFANKKQLIIFPPVQALLSRIDKKYRYKINIKCKYNEKIANNLKNIHIDNKKILKDIRIDIEVNSNKNI